MNIDIELLISSVESRPCLWDKSNDDYKDRVKTNTGWKDVCCVLREDFELLSDQEKTAFGKEVIKKWSNIRDSFRKYLNQLREKGSGSSALVMKKYIYYEQLLFLKKIFAERQTKDSIPLTNTEDKVGGITEDPPAAQRSFSTTTTSHTQSSSHTQSRKRRRVDELDEKMLKALEENENHHLSFFKGTLPAIKDFNEEETIDFQMGVLQLIKGIKNKRANPYSPSYSLTNISLHPFIHNSTPYQQTPPPQQFYQYPIQQFPRTESFPSFLPQKSHQPLEPLSTTTQSYQCLSSPSSSSVTSPMESQIIDVDFT